MKVKIERWVLGELATNCYVIKNEETKELIITDPATVSEQLATHLTADGYQPKAILLTHGHFDHMLGAEDLARRFSIPVYLLEAEKQILADPVKNLSSVFAAPYAYQQGIGLSDGQMISLAGIRIRVLHTPGHTAGGACYYFEEEQILLSGDTLFCGSVGRTDFPTGSMGTLIRSIREKLLLLPDETTVYPGHGEMTTIGAEKSQNPYL